MFRRRQRLFVEMEQMASRPFSQVPIENFIFFEILNFQNKQNFLSVSQVLVDIDSKDREYNELTPTTDVATNVANSRRRKKDSPSPIALEPCAGNKAAVLSLLVRMPTGALDKRYLNFIQLTILCYCNHRWINSFAARSVIRSGRC